MRSRHFRLRAFLLALLLSFSLLPVTAEPSHKITVFGFDLQSTVGELTKKFGTDYEKWQVLDYEEYHWAKPYFMVTADGQRVLKLIGDEATINGRKVVAGQETFDSLSSLLGEPVAKYYGQHGEPCYVWPGGFQALATDSHESVRPDFFVLTTRPDLPGGDPIVPKLKK